MTKCRIVESSKKLWKEKGEIIEKKEYHLFLLETRNKRTNEIVFAGQDGQSERDLYLYIYQGDQDSGVEKIIKVKYDTNQR